MKELKTISELASEIKDDRFLALFSAFVKALDLKDYGFCRKLTILRWIVGIFEDIHFEFVLKIIYKLVLLEFKEKDYLYWEKKLLIEIMSE